MCSAGACSAPPVCRVLERLSCVQANQAQPPPPSLLAQLCSSEACDTPKLPPTPISVPWSPRPFGQVRRRWREHSLCGRLAWLIDSHSPSPAAPAQERPKELELEGLELGPLLGRGAHGRVYRGVWRDGEKVAVKVRALITEQATKGPSLVGSCLPAASG